MLPTRSVRGVAALLTVPLLVFLLGFLRRWTTDAPNVDDYLYAIQTSDFLHGLSNGPHALARAWQAHATNSPLMPMLALPLAALSANPNVLVLTQVIPLVGLAVSSAALLRQWGHSPTKARVGAGLLCCSAPVLSYALMWHFALAATACTVGIVAAYGRSDRLQLRNPVLLMGVLMGFLVLTRVVAPVYAVAVAVPLFVDACRGGAVRAMRSALLVGAVAAVVAAPWWLLCGRTAVSYLTGFGYDTRSGFVGPRAGFLTHQWQRLQHTSFETGLLLTFVLLALVLLAALQRERQVVLPLSIAGLGLVVLGTSGDEGTAFAQPLVALVFLAALHVALQRRWALGSLAAAVLLTTTALLAGLVSPSFSGYVLWSHDLPAEGEQRAALGCTNCSLGSSQALSRQLISRVGGGRVVVVRDDAVLNVNGLTFLSADVSPRPSFQTSPYGAAALAPVDLLHADFVVTGRTKAPYHGGLDWNQVEQVVGAEGYRLIETWRLSSDADVKLWAKGS